MYSLLQKQVKPHLQLYQEDLTIYDKRHLKGFKGGYLHGLRESGTDLVRFRLSDYDYSQTKEQFKEQIKRDKLFLLRDSNHIFHYFNGSTLKRITREQATKKLSLFHKKVLQRYEYSHTLDIEAIAVELLQLIYTTRKWKRALQTHYFSSNSTNNSPLRRLRNRFDYQKIQTTYEYENLRKQLYKHLLYEQDDLM